STRRVRYGLCWARACCVPRRPVWPLFRSCSPVQGAGRQQRTHRRWSRRAVPGRENAATLFFSSFGLWSVTGGDFLPVVVPMVGVVVAAPVVPLPGAAFAIGPSSSLLALGGAGGAPW